MGAVTPAAELMEKAFQDNVIQLAKILGWKVHHDRPARTKHGWATPVQGDRGFPDLILAKKGRQIFAEIKSQKGTLADEQRAWLTELLGEEFIGNPAYPGGIEKVGVFLWRPSDLEEIRDVLGG